MQGAASHPRLTKREACIAATHALWSQHHQVCTDQCCARTFAKDLIEEAAASQNDGAGAMCARSFDGRMRQTTGQA